GDASNRFFERNESDRVSSQFALNHKIGDHSEINVRNSLSYFNRRIIVPDYIFDGNQYGSFSEASYSTWNEAVEWIGGLNLWTDRFKEEKNGQTMTPLRNYDQTTFGGFIQNNLRAAEWLELEAGLRGDYVVDYGFVLLP